VCEAAAEAVDEVGASVHLSCFDMTPGVINLIKGGKVKYTIDQQQRLQGYLPVVVLHLYNTNAGMLPGADIPSGPGFVDATNAADVEAQAGVNR
jgi:simple sugar transport system substrate-binding protein